MAIVAVGTGYDSNQRVLEISQQYKNLVYPALGLHPWQLGHMDPSEVERTLHQIEDSLWQAVAIGEVGLDYDKSSYPVRLFAPGGFHHAGHPLFIESLYPGVGLIGCQCVLKCNYVRSPYTDSLSHDRVADYIQL